MASGLISLLLLLSFSSALVAVSEYWYIDCGAEEGFLSSANRTWVGDGGFVRAGESRRVENTTGLKALATLRAFPKNKKNCYSIPTGEGVKVLATVGFFYGNYDGLQKPPAFGLMFDGTLWMNVQASLEESSSFSAIYWTKRANTSICFGRQMDDQDPFVSTIRVRTLEAGAYGNYSFFLFPLRAVSFGSNETFGFPDDSYDRSWSPQLSRLEGYNYTILASNVSAVNTTGLLNRPPERMFKNAAVPLSGARNLSVRTPYLLEMPVEIYISLYFSEVSENATRSFKLYQDGESIYDELIVPPLGEPIQLYGMLNATRNTTFTMVPTSNSTLPPLINGMEVLWKGGSISEGTDRNDVDALAILQENFQVLENWTGDPCLPETFNWEWVNCSSAETTRVTTISLGGYGLSGILPDFSGLDALEIVDLHNNNLTGRVPSFLARLANLKELNLASNNFSSIPSSLINNSKITVNITGNPLLEKSEAPGSSPTQGSATPPGGNGCNKVSQSTYILSLLVILLFRLT